MPTGVITDGGRYSSHSACGSWPGQTLTLFPPVRGFGVTLKADEKALFLLDKSISAPRYCASV
jgi:hypothetical protein